MLQARHVAGPGGPSPPDHDRGPARGPAGRRHASHPPAGARPVPGPRHPGDLRHPDLARDVRRADGGLARLQVRVPLPLHRGHRAHRVAIGPGRLDHEAVLPPGDRHRVRRGPGDGHDLPVRGVHAAGHAPALHHAPRRGQLPGGPARPRERDAERGGAPGPDPVHGPTDPHHARRRVRAAAVRRQGAHGHDRPRPDAPGGPGRVPRRRGAGDRGGQRHAPGGCGPDRGGAARHEHQRRRRASDGARRRAHPRGPWPDGLPARRGPGGGLERRPDEHRPRERPQGGVPADHQAGRRLDALRHRGRPGAASGDEGRRPRRRHRAPRVRPVDLRAPGDRRPAVRGPPRRAPDRRGRAPVHPRPTQRAHRHHLDPGVSRHGHARPRGAVRPSTS